MSKKKTEDFNFEFELEPQVEELELPVEDAQPLGEVGGVEPVVLDSYELVWYKPKYKTSLLRRGDAYYIQNINNSELSAPAPLQELLRELGLEEDLNVLETQLWVRGLALPEQLEKLGSTRLAELVEDVRKRNK